MMQLLRRRAERGHQDGFTVLELTITMLILSVIVTVAFNFLDRTSLLTVRTEAHARTEDDVQRTLRTMTQNLRGAYPIGNPCTTATDSLSPSFIAGYDYCVQFTVKRTKVGLDTCARTEFVYGIVGTSSPRTLVERRRDYTGTGSGASCTAGPAGARRVLLTNVVNKVTTAPAQPVFQYYGADGTLIPSTNTAAVVKAASVKVTLSVQYKSAAAPVTISSSAALRNNITR